MSKAHKSISEYEFKDDQLDNFTKFRTIQKSNNRDERIFVKNVPSQSVSNKVIVGNILDLPQEVNWRQKASHVEEISPSFQKTNYTPTLNAGSFYVSQGTFQIEKTADDKVVLFPLDPKEANSQVSKFIISGNMSNGTLVCGSVDVATWIAYLNFRKDNKD